MATKDGNAQGAADATEALGRVSLVIASFRNDEAILALLAQVYAGATRSPFHSVRIVDSLGTGRVPEAIRSAGYEKVSYFNSPTNLGSAGNFATRLRDAAQTDADYAYAINHDYGHVDLDAVRALLRHTEQTPRLGAVYPLRRFTMRGGRFRETGRSAIPWPSRGQLQRPPPTPVDVSWGSSNGALYALAPVRAGLTPWDDLWMGWEDLGYGWLLEQQGYRQILARDVVVDEDYESVEKRIGPFAVHVSDKPAWYAYYGARNLVLIGKRVGTPARAVGLAAIMIKDSITNLVARGAKQDRAALVVSGLRDGLLNRSGKWVRP